MFNILIILIAVINLTISQESPEADDLAILSGLSTSSLSCSLTFDHEFVSENEAIASAIKELLAQRDGDSTREKRGRKSRDGDSTRQPCDDDKTEDATTEAPSDLELRRNLREGNRRGGRRDGDSTREPKDPTAEPRERKSRDDSTREPKATREPCVGDDCRKGGKGGRKSRKDEATTEAPEDDLELRRNLRKGDRRGRRGDDSAREPKDATRAPKDVTREPKDVTREPCVGDECQRRKGRKGGRKSRKDEETTEDDLELRRNLRKGDRRGRRGDDDSTREPKDVTREPCDDSKDSRKRKDRGDSDDSSDELATTAIPLRRLLREETERAVDATKEPCDRTREPCVGDDCQRGRKGRKGGRKSRKGEDETTEAPEDVPALRRALGRDGRKRRKGIDATMSNGLVNIAGVTGEVVFGDVDEALESIPLTLTIGETIFQCNVEVQGGNKVSCFAVSDDDFRVRVRCEL